jgi:hypothetical protein
MKMNEFNFIMTSSCVISKKIKYLKNGSLGNTYTIPEVIYNGDTTFDNIII